MDRPDAPGGPAGHAEGKIGERAESVGTKMVDLDISPLASEALSPAARAVLRHCVVRPGSTYTRLVVRDADPSDPDARSQLLQLTPENVLGDTPSPGGDRNARSAVLSGLWLLWDYLEESHRLSQEVHTATGSFWHAIMHRREGDFSNSKYWYARCAGHPAHQLLNARLNAAGLGDWNARAFVDVVEDAHVHPPTDPIHQRAVRIQSAEWSALMEHTLLGEGAAGSTRSLGE